MDNNLPPGNPPNQPPPIPQQPVLPQQPVQPQPPQPSSVYPQINIERIQDPNRFYAIPILGGFIKFIMLVPIIFEVLGLMLVGAFLLFINSFVVLFSGKYWPVAYKLNVGILTLLTKTWFFSFGLTNKYPRFNFEISDNYTVEFNYPQTSSRLYSVTLIGGLIRLILLIPFFIFLLFISYGYTFSSILASFAVLFKGYYPESSFEFARDGSRIYLSYMTYMSGISDKYPSWQISWNHKTMKIAFLVLGAILYVGQTAFSIHNSLSNNLKASSRYNQSISASPTPQASPLPTTQPIEKPNTTIPSKDLGEQLIFDLPPLVNKNQEQVRILLGEPESTETYWTYRKNGVTLSIKFKEDKSSDYIIVLLPYDSATKDPNKLTKLFNITVDSKSYKVTLSHELDDKSYITGFDIDSLQNTP